MTTRRRNELAPNTDGNQSMAGPSAAGSSTAGAGVQAQTREQKIAYIREMTIELRAMAAEVDAAMLAYLLDMAALESAELLQVFGFRSRFERGG